MKIFFVLFFFYSCNGDNKRHGGFFNKYEADYELIVEKTNKYPKIIDSIVINKSSESICSKKVYLEYIVPVNKNNNLKKDITYVAIVKTKGKKYEFLFNHQGTFMGERNLTIQK